MLQNLFEMIFTCLTVKVIWRILGPVSIKRDIFIHISSAAVLCKVFLTCYCVKQGAFAETEGVMVLGMMGRLYFLQSGALVGGPWNCLGKVPMLRPMTDLLHQKI